MTSTKLTKLLTIACFLFSITYSKAQKKDYCTLLQISREYPQLVQRLDSAYRSDITKTSTIDKSIKKELNESIKYRKEFIVELIDNGIIINDAAFTEYYQSILNKILKGNPNLDQNIKIFITRFLDPNAFNTGDGNIYFHLGLLRHLENEDQIAFVIAHELSHQYLNHSYNKLLKSISTVKSDEVQKKIRNANRQLYGSKEALKEISNSLVFDIKKHGRDKEMEADSMAILFLKNTDYSISSAITAFDVLDKLEENEINLKHIKFSQYFNHLPINPRREWDFYNVDTTYAQIKQMDRIVPDSLKTHPDCKLRQSKIEKQFQSLLNDSKNQRNFKEQNLAWLELLNSSINQDNIGYSIHENIRLLEIDSTNKDLKLMLARNFALLNFHQRNRTLSVVLDYPNDVYSREYNYTLSFLNELKTIESAAIAYFTLKNLPPNEDNEEYLYTSIICHFAYKKFEAMDEKIELYNQLFKDGKYSESVALIKTESINLK